MTDDTAVNIRELNGADAAEFRRLRLEGLRMFPMVFAAHYDEEQRVALDALAARLEPTEDRATLGAFVDDALVGIAGLVRETRRNLRHKALLWGMYVTPRFRNKGIGRRLLDAVLRRAEAMQGLRQVNLCVNAASESAAAMYRAAGFEPFGVERTFLIVDGAPQDLILMVRVLDGRSTSSR